MKLAIRVIPNAPRTRISGMRGEEWVLRVAAPALDGRANRAAARYLAGRLGVPVAAVRLVAGERSRHKKFEIMGVDADSDSEVGLLFGDG